MQALGEKPFRAEQIFKWLFVEKVKFTIEKDHQGNCDCFEIVSDGYKQYIKVKNIIETCIKAITTKIKNFL